MMLRAVARTGYWFSDVCEGAGYTLEMFVEALWHFRAAPRKVKEIFLHIYTACFGSMPVIFVVSVFTGMILALLGGAILRDYGQEAAVGFLVSKVMLVDMGPVSAAIAFAGLIGGTMASQLGTMKVSEEIDALEAMSINPVYFLVMPRIIALAIALPVMTVFANAIGILGGAVVAHTMLDVDYTLYFLNAREPLQLRDVYGGILKSTVFGVTIALVACSQGLRAEHGAEGVGKATMRTVVLSYIFVLLFTYFLDWALYFIWE